jgi:hypothetical protein
LTNQIQQANISVVPSAFVVGNGHQFGAFNYNFTNPGAEVLIAPGLPYKFGLNSYGNIIIDVGNGSASAGSKIANKPVTTNGSVIIQTQAFAGVVNTTITSINANPGPTTGSGAILIGPSSVASGSYGMAIGYYCSGNQSSAIGMGYFAAANAANSLALGQVVTAGFGASTAIGFSVITDSPGEFAYGHGSFNTAGDAKYMNFVSRAQTTDATVTELKVNGTDSAYVFTPVGVLTLTNDSTYIFDCDIVGRNTVTDTESAAWNLKFAVRRGVAAANTAVIGTPTMITVGVDTGAAAWSVSVTTDTTNGRPLINVTGEAGKTIRWVGNYRVTKVSG